MFLRRQLPASSPLSLSALLSGLTGALGRNGQASLEQRVRDRWNSRDLVLTGSGTDALTLVLRAACKERASLVALPAYACYDLATAAIAAQARVIFYDLDPETLAPDLASLERALQRKPVALVLVHLFGIPVDVLALASRAAAQGVLVIEDAAQGLGASFKGAPAGSLGSVAVLSFGRGKGLTGGGGGALLANDAAGEDLVNQVRSVLSRPTAGWPQLARTAAQWLFARPEIYALPAALPFLRLGETVYQPPHDPTGMGRSAMSVLNAVWQSSLDASLIRRQNAARLLERAERNPDWHCFPIHGQATAGYLRLPLRSTSRNGLSMLSPATRRLGVIQGYPRPLFSLPELQPYCLDGTASFPGASRLAQSLVTVPTHNALSAADLDALAEWLRPKSGTSYGGSAVD